MWAQALASNIKDTCCAAGADKVGHEATQKDMLGEIQQAKPPKTISNPKNYRITFSGLTVGCAPLFCVCDLTLAMQENCTDRHSQCAA